MFSYTPGIGSRIDPEVKVKLGNMSEDEYLLRMSIKTITKDLSILRPKDKKPYGDEEIFGVLNAYIEEISKEDPNFKPQLEECYIDLYNFTRNTRNISQEDLVVNVNRIVNNILNLFDFYKIKDYIYTAIEANIPEKVKKSLEEKQSESEWNSEEQTYGVEEYIDLAVLCVMFKPIIPVYGLIMEVFKTRLNENAPEMVFYPSNNPSILNLPPIVKLRSWITKNSLKDTTKRSGTAGIGRSTIDNVRARVLAFELDDEEIIDYTITLVLIKYLPFRYIFSDGDPESRDHLVSYIFNKVKILLGTEKPEITKFMERTGNKDSTIDSEDDKESTFEALRVTENISANIEIEANTFLGLDIWYVYERLHPLIKANIDKSILEKINTLTPQIGPLDITRYHIHICKLCCKSYIDPRTIMYVDMNALRNVIGITFSYLWGLGHKELALLLLSRNDKNNDAMDEFSIGFNQRVNVNNEIVEKLVKYYPYVNFGLNRQKSAITDNYMVKYLDELYNLILLYKWIPIQGIDEYVLSCYGKVNYKLPLSIKVKDSLYQLAVDVEEVMLKILNK
jgi:hypothetical protein